jgi:hypothetical protein
LVVDWGVEVEVDVLGVGLLVLDVDRLPFLLETLSFFAPFLAGGRTSLPFSGLTISSTSASPSSPSPSVVVVVGALLSTSPVLSLVDDVVLEGIAADSGDASGGGGGGGGGGGRDAGLGRPWRR